MNRDKDKTDRQNQNSARKMKTARLVSKGAEAGNADLNLVSPALAGLPEGDESVFAMLPIHGANDWLDDIGVSLFKHNCGGIPAVFAADPLLDVSRLLTRFSLGGFREIAIWPSVGVLGGAPDFTPEGLGFSREVEFAQRSFAAGFAVTATVFNSSHVQQMIEAGAGRLILHPPLAEHELSEGGLADWLNSIFPHGTPENIDIYLHAPVEIAHRNGFHSLIAGIPIGGKSGASRRPDRPVERIPSSQPTRPDVSALPFLMRRRETVVVGASVGSGAAAHAVANGGADFVVALNAGRFRMMGVSSSACYLPLRDTNRFVDEFARQEILPHVTVPVFLGVFASDPRRSIDSIVATAAVRGYQGLANFPTVARYSGRYRSRLEARGFGIGREYELMARAKEAGLATLAYARAPEEAEHFASIGTDVLCLQFGSAAGLSAAPLESELEDIAGRAGAIVRRARARNPAVLCLLSGGAILSPQTMMRVVDLAKADGYVGGATFDRFPAANSIEERTAEFKSAVQLRYGSEKVEKQIRFYRRFGLATTESDYKTVHERVRRLATTEVVVISGPRGTGKSLLARLLHATQRARNSAVETVSLNAASGSAPEYALVGSASNVETHSRAKVGWFQLLAGQGLVLDDLDKAQPSVQALLLEAIETKRFRPFGAMASMPFDVRLIITSREPLGALRAAGKLDEDLYQRLRPFEIELRPLRDRLEDIPLIVDFLFDNIDRNLASGIDHAALRALQTFDWPGNVRELSSFLEEAAVSADGRKISMECVESVLRKRKVLVGRPKQMTEREWLLDALRRHKFRRTDAAAFLEISRKTLYNKMKHLKLLDEE